MNNYYFDIKALKRFISAAFALFSAAMIAVSTGCSGDTFQKYKQDRIVEDNTPEPDTSAPYISSVKVDAYNKIEVTFNEEVDAVTALNASNYHIQGINRVGVLSSPAPSLSSDGKTVTLTLSQGYLNGMQHGKDYTILVQKVKDLNNNAVLTEFSSFTGRGQVYATVSYNGIAMATESPWPSINSSSPLFMVIGDNLVSYMYSFDDGAWCSEISLSSNNTISLSSLAEGFHTLKVAGKSSSGKWQDANEATTVGFTVDTTAPTSVLSRLPVSVTSTASCAVAVGGTGVSSYIYRFNSESWSGKVPSTTAIIRKELTPGTYTLSVRGYDDAGNIQTGTTDYTWQVIEDQPVAVLSGLPDKSTKSSSIGITVSGTDVNYYTYTLNGMTSGLCSVSDPISVSGLREGLYTLSVTGMKTGDSATAGPAISYSWTIDQTAPLCSLSNTPLTPTNAQSTHILVSSAAGDVVSYQYCLITGTRKGEQQGPFDVNTAIDLSGLPENNYTIEVMGIDSAGNVQSETSAARYSWSVDISAPAAVLSGLPSTLTNTNSFSVSVGSSGSDLVAYKYLLDDGSGSAPWSSEINASVRIERVMVADGTYTLCVIGRDAAGNWQSMQADAEYTWTIDTAPPVALLGNKPAKITSSTEAHYYVYGSGVVSFQYRLDGGVWSELRSRINTQGTVTTIDYTGLSEGTHTLDVLGIDLAGNRQRPDAGDVTSYSWEINSSLPAANFDKDSLPSTFTRNSSISIIVKGCEKYKYMLDNGGWKGPFDISVPIESDDLGEGVHTISAIGMNTLSGNAVWQDVSNVEPYDWTIDLTAPSATITGINPMPSIWTSSSSITVGIESASFTISGNGVCSYRIAHLTDADPAGYPADGDYAPEVALTSDAATHQITVSNLANGNHRIFVRAKDEAGNWQDVSDATRYFWTVNTIAPQVALSTVATPTQSSSVSVNVAGTSDIVSYSYRYTNKGAWSEWSPETAISTPIKVSGLSDGWHYMDVRGKNSLGVWQSLATASKVNEGVDADGNTTSGWYVDTAPPDLSYFDIVVTSLPQNPTTATKASGIKVLTKTTDANGAEIDGALVSAIKYRLVSGGVAGSWSTAITVDPSTHLASLPSLPESGVFTANEYAVDVLACDSLGNWTTAYKRSDSWKVISGEDLPLAYISTGSLKNPSNDRNPVFTVSGLNITRYIYRLDSGSWSSTWTPVSNPIALSLSDSAGTVHTLDVRGTKSTTLSDSDLANSAVTQTESIATRVSWTFDNSAPAVILSGVPSDSTDTSISVTVSGEGDTTSGGVINRDVVSYQYRIDRCNVTTNAWEEGSWEPTVSGSLISRAAEYPIEKTLGYDEIGYKHRLNVRGFDLAGNASATVSCEWTIELPALSPPAVKAVSDYSAGYLNYSWINPQGTNSVYIEIASDADFTSVVSRELHDGATESFGYLPTDTEVDGYYARVWVSRKTIIELGSEGWGRDANADGVLESMPADRSFGTSPGDQSAKVIAVGQITGKVVDPNNSYAAVSGATVKIFDPKDGGYITGKQTTTGSTGIFTISNVPVRSLTGGKSYYIDLVSGINAARINNVNVTHGKTKDLGNVYLMVSSGTGGVLSGQIIDCNDGTEIVGAKITPKGYVVENGNVVEKSYGTCDSKAAGAISTGSLAGEFKTETLPAGIYSVTITNSGYFDFIRDSTTVNKATVNMDRQAICAVLSEPQVRVVLLWGTKVSGGLGTEQTSPSDIDLHLVGPTVQSSLTNGTSGDGPNPSDRFHIGYVDGYSQMSFDETTGKYSSSADKAGISSTASWVLDDVDYGGPEAMNIFRYGGGQYAKGTYTYSSYIFRTSTSVNEGWGSQAISMYLWDSQGLVTKVSLPSDFTSATSYWKALKIIVKGNSRSKRTIIEGGGFFTGNYKTKAGMDW